MSTPFHPHETCVWDDIPKGLGTSVVAFKSFVKACQTSGECISHFHHIHHSGITISTSWLLNSPIHFVISWSSWPLITCILQCSKLMTIWSSVSLKSIVMAKVLCSRTSLWLWKWFPFTLRFYHWLFRRLSHKPLVSHILLLLRLHFISICGSYHRFFSFHKLHIFGHFDTWTALIGVSQSTFIGEWLLMSKDFIKLLGGNLLYFSIGLNHLKLKKFYLWVGFG